jgi:hypothetical protein
MPECGRTSTNETHFGARAPRMISRASCALAPSATRHPLRLLASLAISIALAGGVAQSARAQIAIDDETLADRPIAKVIFKGLDRVTEREILNNIRVAAGQPFEAQAVRNDVSTLYRLGQFDTVDAVAKVLPDGSIELTYVLTEQPIVRDLQVVGNKLISERPFRSTRAGRATTSCSNSPSRGSKSSIDSAATTSPK